MLSQLDGTPAFDLKYELFRFGFRSEKPSAAFPFFGNSRRYPYSVAQGELLAARTGIEPVFQP